MNLIEVKNLVKSYGKIRAVDGVSFEVRKSEIFGLLGPNGAGKTTTLETIEGLRQADSGEVKIIGREQIGLVLQNSAFLPELTLLELLKLYAGFYKTRTDLENLFRRFDLKRLADRKYAELSGGQKQRFALAMALVNKPVLLILDEPTVGLDPAVRQQFWEEILRLREEGLTILLTTHYMEEAEIVCDRVAIINNGRIVAADRPVKLINSIGVASRIQFMSSKSISLGELEVLPGINEARRNRYTYELETKQPEKSLRALLEWEKKFAGRIFNLQIQQATLDDVFLKLTGRHLRE